MNSAHHINEQPIGSAPSQRWTGFLSSRSPLGPALIGEDVAARLRAIARIWGFVALATLSALLTWRGFLFTDAEGSWQLPFQIILVSVAGVGWLVTWKSEWLGATLMLLGASGLGILAALQHQPLVAFVPCFMLLVPAALYWLCWQRRQTAYVLVILAAVLAAAIAGGGVAANRIHASYFGPTNPASETALEDATLVDWAWSGGVTESSATVKAQLLVDPGTTRLIVLAPRNLRGMRFVEGEPAALDESRIYEYHVESLQPDTTYLYVVEVDGELDMGRSGRFQTFPEGPASFSFAFGSCASTGSNGEVFDAIREGNPLFFLHGGDFHYENIEENDPEIFLAAMTAALTAPAQSALYRDVSVAYVWDDHDYGPNNSDATSPAREASLKAYDAAVPHYALEAAPNGDGIYQAFSVGRVRFILTDLRSQRHPASMPDGPEKSMLGTAQKEWFKQQLLDAKQNYPVIFWISSVPWISAPTEGADDWGGYTYERAELANFIADNNIDGLIMLSGDAHMVALDDGTNSNYSDTPGPGFPILHASALDRDGSTKGGPFSDGTYPGGGHFGQITVIDIGAKQIRVELTGRTWDGEVLVTHSVAINAPTVINPWPDVFGQLGPGYFSPD